MRARLIGAVVVALALAGCSLLISEDLAAEDALPSGEAGVAPSGDDGSTPPNDDGGGTIADGAPLADADAALDPSLLAYWTFEQTPSAVVEDQTGHGHTLILSGAQIVPGAGYRGSGLVVADGQTSIADSLADAAFPKSGTFSAWAKYDWPENDIADRGLLDDWDRFRSHVFIRKDPSVAGYQAAMQPASSAGDYAWVRGAPAQRNVWSHIVMTWDSVNKSAALYANGTLVSSSAYFQYPTTQPTQQKVRIGENFIGTIDEVRIYDRALPAAEALKVP
jgi:hypothetical protein